MKNLMKFEEKLASGNKSEAESRMGRQEIVSPDTREIREGEI